ncbi:MAG: polysaccharide biosynthesis/export family protein [Candidatus Sumerlaeota bacterium]|nr:polysaccharide biosynthesis/export family protein [Candidatus Sumerlaeota bacterium]
MFTRARIAALVVSLSLPLGGCFWGKSAPRYHANQLNSFDLFEDASLKEGDEVVALHEPLERKMAEPLSLAAPEYRLRPGDVVEVTYQTLYESNPEEYTLEIGDQLLVEVLYNPDLTRTATVRPDGRITLPLVGDHYVLGKTTTQIDQELQLIYGRYVKAPEVHVAVQKFNSRVDEILAAMAPLSTGQRRTEPVRPDGRITLPLIGDVNAAGYSVKEIAEDVQKRYTKAARGLRADLGLSAVVAPQVYVMGRVKTAGAFPINGRITAAQAITLAGDALDDGDLERVVLVKHGVYAEPTSYLLNVKKMLREGRLETDVMVEANDLVYVPKMGLPQVYVAGDVAVPGAFLFEPGMDIFDAIALAQGSLPTAQLDSVLVMRRTNVKEPVAFRVDLTKAIHRGDMRYNLALQPNDAIFVPKTYISRVDQWIDQWMTQGVYSAFPDSSSLGFLLDARDLGLIDWNSGSSTRTRSVTKPGANGSSSTTTTSTTSSGGGGSVRSR